MLQVKMSFSFNGYYLDISIKVYIISNSSFDVNIFRNAKLERKGASIFPVRWSAAQMAKTAFPMSAVDVKVKPVKMTCDVYWSK